MKHRNPTMHLLLLILMWASLIPVGAQDITECEAGFRLFDHDLLDSDPVCVPENPQRIVAHYFASEMIALDLPMIGTNYINAELVVSPEQLEGITDTGIGDPNVETVLSLDPDLIFVPDFTDSGVVELLEEIAPTVVIPYGGDPFARLRLFGELVGKPEVADEWIEAFDAKAAALQAEAAPFIEEGETATAFIMYGDDQLYVYGRPRFGLIMNDVFGFAVPPQVTALFEDDPDALWQSVSIELLPEYAGDTIFLVLSEGEAAQEATNDLINDPIWQTLPAVQNDKVYFVSSRWAFNDPLTLDWLVEEMASVLMPHDLEQDTAQQNTTQCEEGFRLFDHEYLATDPVCIPESPQRIVVAWPFNVTALLRAGVPIIGTRDIEFNQGQFPEWQEELGEIADVGNPINLETVLSLSPDLIITSDFNAEGNEEAFSSIAPTVLFTWEGTHIWRDVAELMFDATGHLEDFDALLAEEEARANELGALIEDPQETELSIVNVRADRVLLYTQYSPGGMIVDDIGFSRPDSQLLPVTADEHLADPDANPAFGAPYLREISLEQLQLAEGDYMLIFGEFALNEDAQSTLDQLLANPLWQTLNAVQTDQVYISTVNFAGGDIGNAHAMLDELAAAFGVEAEFSPNPYVIKAPIPDVDTEPVEAEAPSEASSASFPITLTHSLGTIEIPAPPERVIAMSMGDTDMAYAFGLTPVAIHQNGYDESGLWPWLADQYDPEQTEILPVNDVSFEHILQLQPDLILAGSRWNTADLYPGLADIAPTTAWLSRSFADTWQEQTLFAGQALGMEATAQQLIDETESQIAAVSEVYPELVGKTFSLSFLYNESSINTIYSQSDFAVQFFQELGFVVTPALAELAAEQGDFQGALSLETLNLIEADLVVLAFGSPEVQAAYEANPLYQQLPAVQEGRVVIVDLSTVTQLRAPSVIGIGWVLDQLHPALAALAES